MSPENHVASLLRTLGIASRDLDRLREGHENWPGWCFAPFRNWIATILPGVKDPHKLPLFFSAITVIPWRYSRSVYRFDPDIYRELISTPFSGDIPTEVLLRIPEWSIFVEMQEESVNGFFASLNLRRKAADAPFEAVLLFVFCTEDGLVPFDIKLSDGTIENAFSKNMARCETFGSNTGNWVGQFFSEHFGDDFSLLKKALSLVLYICSDEAEIRDRDVPDWEPSFPRPKITKGVERLFPADRNRIVDVGRELGAMLREGATHGEPGAPTGRTVRPHLRRGHWHGYWTGPRKENRDLQKFVLKWLPPIYVHGRGQ